MGCLLFKVYSENPLKMRQVLILPRVLISEDMTIVMSLRTKLASHKIVYESDSLYAGLNQYINAEISKMNNL